MDLFRHLFVDGEFAERSRILADLDLEHVTTRPGAAPHSIYEELWHLTRWQHVVVYRDMEAYEEWEKNRNFLPPSPPPSRLGTRLCASTRLASKR